MKNETKLKSIIKYVTRRVGVDIESSRRDREVIYGRALYYKIALRAMRTSYKNVGAAINKDHATVINAKNNNFHILEEDSFYMSIYRDYFGETKVEDTLRSIDNEILTQNEKAYRELSGEDRVIYDERASLVLRSFEWKRKDDNREEVFETINISQ